MCSTTRAGRRVRPSWSPRHAIVEVDERIDRDGAGADTHRHRRDARRGRPARRRATGRGAGGLLPLVVPQPGARAGHRRGDPRAAPRHLPVVSGAELHPAIREYERTTVAVLNAYVSGALPGIEDLEARLARARASPSRCSSCIRAAARSRSREARRRPLGLAVSGPAAGVAAAIDVGAAAGHRSRRHLRHGRDVVRRLGRRRRSRRRGGPAARSAGCGPRCRSSTSSRSAPAAARSGGSTPAGMLRVGPRSAGAVPGPACYGRGGTDPTVTDALVVLGYIDPDRFLGGTFPLDADAALDACERLGEALGLDGEDVAWGIREVALAGMAKATRARLRVARARPARAGAAQLRRQRLAVHSGHRPVDRRAARARAAARVRVLSAFGAATTDVRRERICPVLATCPGRRRATIEKLARGARARRSTPTSEPTASYRPTGRSRSRPTCASPSRCSSCRSRCASATPTTADADALVGRLPGRVLAPYGPGSIVLGSPIELVACAPSGRARRPEPISNATARGAGTSCTEPAAGHARVRLAARPDGEHDDRGVRRAAPSFPAT